MSHFTLRISSSIDMKPLLSMSNIENTALNLMMSAQSKAVAEQSHTLFCQFTRVAREILRQERVVKLSVCKAFLGGQPERCRAIMKTVVSKLQQEGVIVSFSIALQGGYHGCRGHSAGAFIQ
jgi:hypothetical protein